MRRTTTTPPGLTVGIASRVETERRTVFVKAVPVRSPALPGYRRERAVAEALPSGVPAPRLLWGCEGGWLTLVFEHVGGRHVDLFSEAPAVMRTLLDMRDRLVPSPVPGMRPIREKLDAFLASARSALNGGAEEIDRPAAAHESAPLVDLVLQGVRAHGRAHQEIPPAGASPRIGGRAAACHTCLSASATTLHCSCRSVSVWSPASVIA